MNDDVVEISVEFAEHDETVLKCPVCGYNYMHQVQVTSIFRDNEDADGTKVEQTRAGTSVSRIPDEEIEGRRDVCYITFDCEGCDEDHDGNKTRIAPVLKIVQHKGQTFLQWVVKKSDIEKYRLIEAQSGPKGT